MGKKMGRPKKADEEKRIHKAFSLSAEEIAAIEELARMQGESKSSVAGKLFVRELTRKKRT